MWNLPDADEPFGGSFGRFQCLLLFHSFNFGHSLDDVLLTLPSAGFPSFQILKIDKFELDYEFKFGIFKNCFKSSDYRLPIFRFVFFLFAYLFDFLGFLELLLSGGGQFGRSRFDELHRIVGNFGRCFGRSGRYVFGRTEILHLHPSIHSHAPQSQK